MRRLKWIGVVGIVAVLGIPAGASAGTPDQTQAVSSFSFTAGCRSQCATVGQTFTAGRSGALDQVDLYLARETMGAADLTVEIRTVDSGCPSGADEARLASQVVPAASIQQEVDGNPTVLVSVTFTSPANITAGTQYGIVLYSNGPYFAGGAENTDPYTSGRLCVAVEDANPWFDWGPAGENDDLAFTTYVEPTVVTPPPPPPPPTPPAVDTNAPETTITKAPRKRTDTGKVKVRFAADEAGSSFECKLKGTGLKPSLKRFNACTSPRKYKNLDGGDYRFKVRATDAAGNVDPTPAKASFRILD
ncbi:MAG TPA: hypothetical protein VHF58_03835 [Solirubrobacterales bacterium]|nr:hypothetical protein [Solirubrobacterales bacterium]